MTAPLVFDERVPLGARPGLHALVVGVDSYPFLKGGATEVADHWDMGQLTCAATSAARISDWLEAANVAKRLPVPLATCRLLVSPTPPHAAAPNTRRATLDNFSLAAQAWRVDCNTHRDNLALFYFVGHGVQRDREDAVLCLEDFRNPVRAPLQFAVALSNLRDAMSPAPDSAQIARSQFYFVDSCRVQPERLKEFKPTAAAEVFVPSLKGEDDRCAPIYFAATSNTVANGVPNGPTLFCRGLIDSLEGEAGQALEETAAGEVPWAVTVNSLNAYLEIQKIDAMNRSFQADQSYATGGQFRERTICFLSEPPPVEFTLELSPEDAAACAHVRLGQAGASPVVDTAPPLANPYEHATPVPGGIYRLEIDFLPPRDRRFTRDYPFRPVRAAMRVKVQ